MKISDKKKEKINQQILDFLYSNAPRSFFTSHIAEEIARDEEFVKNILFELRDKRLIVEIKKNPDGKTYLRRIRWKLSDPAYEIYKSKQ